MSSGSASSQLNNFSTLRGIPSSPAAVLGVVMSSIQTSSMLLAKRKPSALPAGLDNTTVCALKLLLNSSQKARSIAFMPLGFEPSESVISTGWLFLLPRLLFTYLNRFLRSC